MSCNDKCKQNGFGGCDSQQAALLTKREDATSIWMSCATFHTADNYLVVKQVSGSTRGSTQQDCPIGNNAIASDYCTRTLTYPTNRYTSNPYGDMIVYQLCACYRS